MTKHMFAALAFAAGAAMTGDAQALLPVEPEPPKPAAHPKPAESAPPQKAQPSPTVDRPSRPSRSTPRHEHRPEPRNHPSQPHPAHHHPHAHPKPYLPRRPAHWCEDMGGKKNAQGLCEVPYTEKECAQEGGELDTEGFCHLPVSDCASAGAAENEEGTCIARRGKKRRTVEPEPEAECAGDEEANEHGECLPIQTSEQDCKENQGTWDSLHDSCVPKE